MVKPGNTFHLHCFSNKYLEIRWTFQTSDTKLPDVLFNGANRAVNASVRHNVKVDKEHGSVLTVTGMTSDDVGIYKCYVMVSNTTLPETLSFTVLLDGHGIGSSEIGYYMAAIGGLAALVVVVAISCFCWKTGRCCKSKSKPDTNKSVSRAPQPVYSVVVDPEDRWLQKCAMKQQNEQLQQQQSKKSSSTAAASAATASPPAAAPASKDIRMYYDDVREKKKTPRKYQKNVKPAAAGPGTTAVPAAAAAAPLEPVVYSVAHSSFATIPAKASKNTYSSYSEIALVN